VRSSIQVKLWVAGACLASGVFLFGMGCSSKPPVEKVAATTSETPASAAVILVPGTTFSGEPNPVPASNPVVKLTWKAKVSEVEVHVGSPNGPLFAKLGGESSASTGPWVTNNMVFYLQDSTAKNPGDATATLATLTVQVR